MSDIVTRARDYLAANAAESWADVLIADLADEIERLRRVGMRIAIVCDGKSWFGPPRMETEAERIVAALEAHLFARAAVGNGEAGPGAMEHTRSRLVKVIAETLSKIDVRTHVRPD